MHKDQDERRSSGLLFVDRRRFLGSAAAAAAGAAAAGPAGGQESAGRVPEIRHSSFSQVHDPRPLPFDPSSLEGLSTHLLESHWTNNYMGSVRALNEVNGRLAAALDDDTLPAYIYNGLKREHLMRTGSVVLHELYFENLGGNGRPDAQVRQTLAESFGEYDRWEQEFRRIAAGLGGGSGWVVLGYNRHLHALENYWLADHMHCPVDSQPLLVLDMYEHSYHMDFGAEAAMYVDAFFRNIQWEAVLRRVEAIV